jgi:hypothetical protein
MGKRALKKRIESLLRRVKEHEMKIQIEEAKETPDYGLIQHWQAEIDAFQLSIKKARKRLEG